MINNITKPMNLCDVCKLEYPDDNVTLHCCHCKINHCDNYCTSCNMEFSNKHHCCLHKTSKNLHCLICHKDCEKHLHCLPCNAVWTQSGFHCCECKKDSKFRYETLS